MFTFAGDCTASLKFGAVPPESTSLGSAWSVNQPLTYGVGGSCQFLARAQSPAPHLRAGLRTPPSPAVCPGGETVPRTSMRSYTPTSGLTDEHTDLERNPRGLQRCHVRLSWSWVTHGEEVAPAGPSVQTASPVPAVGVVSRGGVRLFSSEPAPRPCRVCPVTSPAGCPLRRRAGQ